MPPFLQFPIDLATISLLVLAWTGVGLRILGPTFEDLWLRRFVACGLGLACFIWGLLLAGSMAWFTAPVMWLLVAVFVAIGYGPLADDVKRLDTGAIFRWFEALSPFEIGLLVILGLAVLTHLLFGYAPPTGDDELVYQISLPRLYAAAGRLLNTPDNYAGYYPLNSQLLFTAILLLRGVLAVKVLVWIFGIILSLAFVHFSLTHLHLNRTPALITWALFYTMPYMTSLQGICCSDMFSLFYGLLATLLLWEVDSPLGIVTMGIFGGTAMGMRYYASTWIFSIAVILVFSQKRYRDAALFLAVAGLVFSPWPIRNFLLTGNPLYPKALGSLPHNPYFSAVTLLYATSPLWKRLALAPLQLPYGNVIWGMGLLPAAFAPFALFDADDRKTIWTLTFLALSTIALTFAFPFGMDRYFGQGFLYVALLAGKGWQQAWRTIEIRWRPWFNRWLMVALLIPNLGLSVFFGVHRLRYFLGLQTEDDYLTAHYTIGEGHLMTRFIHSTIPAASKILFLGSQQGFNFYYQDWTLVDMIHYPPSFYNQPTKTWATGLQHDGIHYVVVMDRYFTDNPDGTRHWWPVKGINLNIPKMAPPFFRERYHTPYATLFEVVKFDQ